MIHTSRHSGLQGFGAEPPGPYVAKRVQPHFPSYRLQPTAQLGSYYQSDYYRNPVPYTSSDIGEPVPGWGTTASIAGPARVGVGAPLGAISKYVVKPTVSPFIVSKPGTTPAGGGVQDAEAQPDGTAEGASEPLPWWVWPLAAAVVLGAGGYYATIKGYI